MNYLIQRKATGSYFVRSNGMKGGAVWSADVAQAMTFNYWDAVRVITANDTMDYWEIKEESTMTVVNFETIATALEAKGIPAYVEQTGGGTATIMVGKLHPVTRPSVAFYPDSNVEGGHVRVEGEPVTEDRYDVLVGPGWFEEPYWREGRGDTVDLAIGPDDDGDSDAFICPESFTEAEVLAEIEKQYREAVKV